MGFLIACLMLYAGPTEGTDAIGQESNARWEEIVALKNSSQTGKLVTEAEVQMEWFRRHGQWDNYYRTWQLRANAFCALGKLQQSLHETQRMLGDAKERNNKLGRALAYKQIGIIYLNMKQTEPAVEALRHYAELMGDEGDINSLSNIYYRMCKAYDYDKAYKQELQVADEWYYFLLRRVGKQKRPEIRQCYNAFYLARAAALIGLKRFDEAGMALDTAGHHSHLINTALSLHHYYKMQARYHLAKGDAATALLYTDSVRQTTDERDDHAEEVRAQALMALGQGADAAQIYQRLYHEKDSLFGRDARQHLDELNTLFQLDELKTEQQQTKFRYTLIAASSVVLALLVLLLYGWRTAIRQKRVNEQLRIANERAKVSSKMKTEFIRNITHEIRTPMNILSGFTQILTTPGMDLPENEKKDIQAQVTENTDRLAKIVDRMLELSDTSSETLIERNDQTDVQDIVAQAIDHSQIASHTRPENPAAPVTFINNSPLEQSSLATEGTQEFSIFNSQFSILTNRLFAVRALSQLLENAVKFTHEGTITLRMESTDSHVRFIVEDTGIGIPADQTEHIFEEFVQLDEFVDGTGIGLTIARSIAQRMGGDLWLDTTYSPGARFVLELLRT